VEQEKRGRRGKDRQGVVLPAVAVALKARWDARRVWKGASLALPSLLFWSSDPSPSPLEEFEKKKRQCLFGNSPLTRILICSDIQ
jgi:hypothetical protein